MAAIAADGRGRSFEENLEQQDKLANKVAKAKAKVKSVDELVKSSTHNFVKQYEHKKGKTIWRCCKCLASKAASQLPRWLKSHQYCMAKSVPVGPEIAPAMGTMKEGEEDPEDDNFHHHEEAMETFQEVDKAYVSEEDVFGYAGLGFDDGGAPLEEPPAPASEDT